MCRLGCHVTVHPDRIAIVDPADFVELPKVRWLLRRGKYGEYAYSVHRINGRVRYLYLHRWIMKPPLGHDVHHKNQYGLDCRRVNMENLPKAIHDDLHRLLRIATKKQLN